MNVLIILAPAVFGGRERGRRHVWDPARWKEEQTTEIEDWRGNGDKLSFRNFPKAGVVTYSEHRASGMLPSGDGLKNEGNLQVNVQGKALAVPSFLDQRWWQLMVN